MQLSRSLLLVADTGERALDKLSGVLLADSVSLTAVFKICHVFPGLPQRLSTPSTQGMLLKIPLRCLGYQGHHESQRLDFASLVAWLTVMRIL